MPEQNPSKNKEMYEQFGVPTRKKKVYRLRNLATGRIETFVLDAPPSLACKMIFGNCENVGAAQIAPRF